MQDPFHQPIELLHDSTCHGDAALLKRLGRFRAAIQDCPRPALLARANFPDVPMLVIEAANGWDAGFMQAITRGKCEVGTFHMSVAADYQLLGISLSVPDFTLAIVADPFSLVGRRFIERWHETRRILYSFCHRTSYVRFVSSGACSAGVSELRAMATPAKYDERLFVPGLMLPRIFDALKRQPGVDKLVVVAASDAGSSR